MKVRNAALIAALSTTAMTSATPASALFGTTCLPRLKNCYCTYLSPCPVIDFNRVNLADNIAETSKKSTAETKKGVSSGQQRVLGDGGSVGGLMPGFNSIGINFDSMLQEQFDKVSGALENLTDQLKSIDLTQSDMTALMNGSIDPSAIMKSLNESGINAMDLQQLGLSQDSINGLLNGTLSQKDILAVSGPLGIKGDLLKSIGMTPDALKGLSNGSLTLGDLENNISSVSGLNFSDLENFGVDIEAISKLAETGDLIDVQTLVGQMGIGEFSKLAESTQMKGMISGSIDPSQMIGLAGSLGFSPESLKTLGVASDTIDSFKNGSFTAGQLIEISSAMGIQGDALKAFGLESQVILDVASGKISPEQVLKIAQKHGLTSADLTKAGLDLNSVVQIAKNKDMSEALNLIERSGLGNNPLSSLGITSKQISGVIDGTVSAQELGKVLAAQGIDPAAVVFPTADGRGVNGLGQTVENFVSDMNISIDDISGIRETLLAANGLSSKIPSVSASNLLTELSKSAGIDLSSPEFMNKLIDGSISGSNLLSFMNKNGLGEKQLKKLGIKSETISAFKSGNFTSEQLVNLATNIGLGSNALDNLGIGSNSLSKIARGEMSVNEFSDIAKSVGLSEQTLSKIGLTPEALNSIASTGSTDLATQVAKDAAGAAPENIQVPLEPGSPLAETVPQNSPQPTVKDIGETCIYEKSLITVQDPPNFFGDDAARIDISLSSGDMNSYEEAMTDGRANAALNQSHVLARSIQVKNILVDALDAYDSFSDQMKNDSASRDDDIKLNNLIKMQLIMAQAEVTSLMTFLASSQAAALVRPDVYTVTPTFPNGPEWEATIKNAAQQRADDIVNTSEKYGEVADQYSDFKYQTNKVVHGYNQTVNARKLEESASDLITNIQYHEDVKANLYELEGYVKNVANVMFEDGDSAAVAILNDLKRSSGNYYDENKWEKSNSKAFELQSRTVSGNSSYGTRKKTTFTDIDGRPVVRLTAAPAYPYAYPPIDSISQDDPYYIVVPETDHSVRDDPQPPPPLVGLYQYYMETYRREAHEGQSRRGSTPNVMSQQIWSELTANSPECLIGPVESTSLNFSARPELFDISPYCTNLIFTGGDAEDYLPAAQMGGTDALLWRSKVDIDLINTMTGGPESLKLEAERLLEAEYRSKLSTDLSEFGLPGWKEEFDDRIKTLNAILTDQSYIDYIRLE